MDLEAVSALGAGLVALLCAVITAASWRAMQRTGNRAIGYVIAAFAVLALKNLIKAISLGAAGDETEGLEAVFSLVDLLAVALIAAPLLLRRGPST